MTLCHFVYCSSSQYVFLYSVWWTERCRRQKTLLSSVQAHNAPQITDHGIVSLILKLESVQFPAGKSLQHIFDEDRPISAVYIAWYMLTSEKSVDFVCLQVTTPSPAYKPGPHRGNVDFLNGLPYPHPTTFSIDKSPRDSYPCSTKENGLPLEVSG